MERTPFTISDWEWSVPYPVPIAIGTGRVTEWKGEIGDVVQDFLGKLFAWNAAFREMQGNVLSDFYIFNQNNYVSLFTNNTCSRIMNNKK